MASPSPSSEDTETGSISSSSSESRPHCPRFPRFNNLPPELRHHIWRLAVPSPGVNFFNVHSFPDDHAGCNRSTSPPWTYLDLRRLSIEDDDEAVSRYDPSAWQARLAVRRSCREASIVCAIPPDKSATVTLTRPRRGLFVRAGDGQLRKTPLYAPVPNDDYGDDENNPNPNPDPDPDPDPNTNTTTNTNNSPNISNNTQPKPTIPQPEPVVHRRIEIHTSDILALSIENCSFNLPHEEFPVFAASSASVHGNVIGPDDDDDEGWAFDPQLTPPLPSHIPPDRLCVNMVRGSRTALRSMMDAVFGLLYGHLPGYLTLRPGELWPARLLVMFDAVKQARTLGAHKAEEPDPTAEIVHDRFGDSYARLPWRGGGITPPDGFPITYYLAKRFPEVNDVRERYAQAGMVPSPKRPARPGPGPEAIVEE